jgi:hypothetical protein
MPRMCAASPRHQPGRRGAERHGPDEEQVVVLAPAHDRHPGGGGEHQIAEKYTLPRGVWRPRALRRISARRRFFSAGGR